MATSTGNYRLGALLFDDPSSPGRGWLSLHGDSPVRIQNPGAIPTGAVLISNLAQSNWAPRILDEQFLGMGSVLRLLSEWGEQVTKRRVGRMDRYEAMDPRASVQVLSQWFIQIWERFAEFEDIGVHLERDGSVADSLPSALAKGLTPRAWKAAHADLPPTLGLRMAQDGGVDYWIQRPVRRSKGMLDRVLKRDRFTWALDILDVFYVPMPPWRERRLRDPFTESIIFGEISDIADDWGTWWIPGTGGIQERGKSMRKRDRWSPQEWALAESLGAKRFDDGGYTCAQAQPFFEAFPLAAEVFARLSPFSWIDGIIAGMLLRIVEAPLNRQGLRSPARHWLRGTEMLMDMHGARAVRESARHNGMAIEVMGYGAGKCHLTHALNTEDWMQFVTGENLAGWIALPLIPKVDE